NLETAAEIALGAALFWVVWYFLVSLMRRLTGGMNHPRVDDQPLPRSRRALFWLMVVVFVAVFMPVPFRQIMSGSTGAAASRISAGPGS
ncbi:MAG TPA: hypothetical protein VKQ32_29925, partial [Polyangia bacterium]|nr:hypothetical protein [Polyangia bacterium]